MTKLDITSGAVEKALDFANDFIGKLVFPAVEQTGGILADNIWSWRLKNQIRILDKTRKYIEKNNIKIKPIDLKLMCPFLEYSSLEHDDEMQETWAKLLSNMANTEQSLQNHVFPYMLSQISKKEFKALERLAEANHKAEAEFMAEIHTYVDTIPLIYRKSTIDFYSERKAEENLPIRLDALENFEVANIVRLGIIVHKIDYELEENTEYVSHLASTSEGSKLGLSPIKRELKKSAEYVFTELGQMFVSACVKNSQNDSDKKKEV